MSGSTVGCDATVSDDYYFSDLAGYSLGLEDMLHYHW